MVVVVRVVRVVGGGGGGELRIVKHEVLAVPHTQCTDALVVHRMCIQVGECMH